MRVCDDASVSPWVGVLIGSGVDPSASVVRHSFSPINQAPKWSGRFGVCLMCVSQYCQRTVSNRPRRIPAASSSRFNSSRLWLRQARNSFTHLSFLIISPPIIRTMYCELAGPMKDSFRLCSRTTSSSFNSSPMVLRSKTARCSVSSLPNSLNHLVMHLIALHFCTPFGPLPMQSMNRLNRVSSHCAHDSHFSGNEHISSAFLRVFSAPFLVTPYTRIAHLAFSKNCWRVIGAFLSA